jgi:hypothetical protein
MILSERAYIQNKGSEEGSEEEVENANNGNLYDDVLNGETDSAATNASEINNDSSSGVGSMPIPNGHKQGDFKHSTNQQTYAPPTDIPTGEDDDIVARQIREAALKEVDPTLREKLWQEYRKYKNQGEE